VKILHVVTLSELGGSQSVVVNLTGQSIEDGHEVMVAASATGELWNILSERVEKRPIKSLRRAIRLFRDFQTFYELKKINREFKPDVIHLHSSKIGVLGRLAFPRHKIIYTVHGFDSIRVVFRSYLPIERILQSRAAHIVAVSQYDYKNLLFEGITQGVSWIYNGIEDYSIRTNSLLGNPESHKRIIDEGSFSVLCIARISPQKRFNLFCEVAKILANRGIKFYWIGNKEQPTNLPSNVICLGEIPHAHRHIPEANLLILPTNYEGMPISVIEALCYGIPVVASDVGGIKEILDGTNGIALPNDVEMFADRILHYMEDQSYYQLSKKEARVSYLKNFTVSQMYNSYKNLYEHIVNKDGLKY